MKVTFRLFITSERMVEGTVEVGDVGDVGEGEGVGVGEVRALGRTMWG